MLYDCRDSSVAAQRKINCLSMGAEIEEALRSETPQLERDPGQSPG